MTKDLQPLLARVEEASGADRELDERLWAEFDNRYVEERDNTILACCREHNREPVVLGWIDPGKHARNFQPAAENALNYTSSLDAALALVERCLPGAQVSLCDQPVGSPAGPHYAGIIRGFRADGVQVGHYEIEEETFGRTRPLALLSALLQALLSQEKAT